MACIGRERARPCPALDFGARAPEELLRDLDGALLDLYGER